MKIKSLKYHIILLLTISFTFVLGCEKEQDKPPIKIVEESMKLSIRDIYKIYADSGNNYTFDKDYMLYATVIMDDRSGNIYKEAYLQDSTGGINIYKLSTSKALSEGDYIRLNLKGSSIVYYKGKMELVFAGISNFSNSMVIQEKNKPIEPQETTIQEIINKKFDCQLVKLKEVQFSDPNSTFATKGGNGFQNKDLENCNGEKIIIRTSDRAIFADEKLPSGKGEIIGVVTKYQNENSSPIWQILIRKISDLKLNGNRCADE